MKIRIIRQINAPAESVWNELWNRYDRVCEWASTVNESDSRKVSENYLNGRTCISTWGEVSELVDTADPDSMTYTYHADGLPAMLKSAYSSWKVVPKSVNTCELIVNAEILFAPLPGFLMGWMLKPKMKKDLHQTLDDFKYFIETGEQTEAKKRSDAKFYRKKGNKAA